LAPYGTATVAFSVENRIRRLILDPLLDPRLYALGAGPSRPPTCASLGPVRKGASKYNRIWTVTIIVTLLGAGRADAYLDPGSGSVLFQTIIAGLLALLFGVKVYWRRLRSWFRPRHEGDTPARRTGP